MLCYSSLGLPDWPIGDLCALLKQFDFGGIEIALTPEQIRRRSDDAFWGDCLGVSRSYGVAITNLHLGNPRLNPSPGEPTLLHDNPARRSLWLGYIDAAYEIAARVGCGFVTIASGPSHTSTSTVESWRRLLSVLRESLARRPNSCTLLLEHEPEHFIRSTRDLQRLHDETEGQVFVNLDIGHLEVIGESISESIEALGGLIKNVHLEDIKDRRHRHLLPGEGDIDFGATGEVLKKIGYEGLLTADLYPYADRPIYAMAKAREAFGASFS